MAFRSERYLGIVRAHDCMTDDCQTGKRIDPHHCAPRGVPDRLTEKGMARKHNDMWTVPLCREHHDFIEDNGVLPGLDREQTDHAIAMKQLELMAAYIRVVDPETDLF